MAAPHEKVARILANIIFIPLLLWASVAGVVNYLKGQHREFQNVVVISGVMDSFEAVQWRPPSLGAVVFGLAGLAVADRPRARRAAVALGALAFLCVAGIAFYHVGVEQLWWLGTAECHAPSLDLDASIESLRQQLLNTKFVPCDEVAWSLFGISMAGYNFFAALGFAGASLWAGLRGAG